MYTFVFVFRGTKRTFSVERGNGDVILRVEPTRVLYLEKDCQRRVFNPEMGRGTTNVDGTSLERQWQLYYTQKKMREKKE